MRSMIATALAASSLLTSAIAAAGAEIPENFLVASHRLEDDQAVRSRDDFYQDAGKPYINRYACTIFGQRVDPCE